MGVSARPTISPELFTSVAKLFPMQQLADGLQYAFDPRTAGLGFKAGNLGNLLVWTVVGAVLAVIGGVSGKVLSAMGFGASGRPGH